MRSASNITEQAESAKRPQGSRRNVKSSTRQGIIGSPNFIEGLEDIYGCDEFILYRTEMDGTNETRKVERCG